MLSFAEFYKPKFFLLENVLGLLTHKLQNNKPGPQEGEMVANGMIKFILRALTSLGYVVVFERSSFHLGGAHTDAAGRTAIRSASTSCRPEFTGRHRIVAALSFGAHGAAFRFPSSRSQLTILRRRCGTCSLTRVSGSSPSPATQNSRIAVRLSAP